jgi:type I restriction enzyme S subunit
LVGTVGCIDIAPSSFAGANLVRATGMIDIEDELIKHWVLYYIRTRQGQQYIEENLNTTVQRALNIKDLCKMPIPITSKHYMGRIVSILKSLDDKIEVNRKINENLEQQAQALFKSWFVDFEPFKNGEFVESELGMIPKGWRVYSLSEFLPVITGKKDANVAKGGPYPFFSCSQDYGWTDDYSFEGNAILVAGNGDFNVKMYNGKFEAYQRTYVLIPHNPQYTAWLFYAVKYHLNDITSAARGSVIKFITKGNLADFRFPAPSNLDKTEVIERFSCIKRIVASNQQESRRLAELRDTLLPKLMSGELKVNEIEK